MKDLKYEELLDIEGGNNVGNTLIFVGSILIGVGTAGTAGLLAGIAVGAIGLLSGWE